MSGELPIMIGCVIVVALAFAFFDWLEKNIF